MPIMIKPAVREDFSTLRAIELASFETLRSVGAISGPATASSDEELQRYFNAGLLYAAYDENVPVGFAGPGPRSAAACGDGNAFRGISAADDKVAL